MYTVDNEVAYRLAQGYRQVSFAQFKAEYKGDDMASVTDKQRGM